MTGNLAAPRKGCDHPAERKRQRWGKSRWTGELIKMGSTCLDCYSIKQRAQYAEKARTLNLEGLSTMFGKDGAAPSREVLAGALCGHDMDERFITDPKFLSDADKAELATWCGNCPVRKGCLEWAKHERGFSGVAGGYAFDYTGNGATKRVAQPLLKSVLTGYASQQEERSA